MNDPKDPKDAYLEQMLEEEHAGDESPDLTERIAEGLEKPAPTLRFRRPAMQIAASILFFVSIISAIVLVPTARKPEPKPVTPAQIRDLLDRLGGQGEEYVSYAEQRLVDMGAMGPRSSSART